MINFITENTTYIYIGLSTVLLVLAVYLGLLIGHLRSRKAEQVKQYIKLEENLSNQKSDVKESIRIICLATIQGQCEVSEAVIRLEKLLEFMPEIKAVANTRILHEAYSEFSEFSYLDDRKDLTKQERFFQDKKRFKVEDEYGSKVKDVCQEILFTIQQ